MDLSSIINAERKSLKDTFVSSQEVIRKSIELDAKITKILRGYVMDAPVELCELASETEKNILSTQPPVPSQLSKDKKSSIKLSGNKSRSQQISLPSMLKRNLTANDDAQRLLARKKTVDDVKFEREDAKIKSNRAVVDAKRRDVRTKDKKKVQETR